MSMMDGVMDMYHTLKDMRKRQARLPVVFRTLGWGGGGDGQGGGRTALTAASLYRWRTRSSTSP